MSWLQKTHRFLANDTLLGFYGWHKFRAEFWFGSTTTDHVLLTQRLFSRAWFTTVSNDSAGEKRGVEVMIKSRLRRHLSIFGGRNSAANLSPDSAGHSRKWSTSEEYVCSSDKMRSPEFSKLPERTLTDCDKRMSSSFLLRAKDEKGSRKFSLNKMNSKDS